MDQKQLRALSVELESYQNRSRSQSIFPYVDESDC